MKPLALILLAAGGLLLIFGFLSRPLTPELSLPAPAMADLANGEHMYRIGGCAACHALPGDEAKERDLLGGGRELETPFGLFRMPNISPDPAAGIGAWSEQDFVRAMKYGVSPDGRHYYPAFPYVSYARMRTTDVLDLWAWLQSLPPVENEAAAHQLTFPWNLRRGIGLWKRFYLDGSPVVTVDESDAALLRGRYLSEGPGHCGECHTPRDALGGPDHSRWLAGAQQMEGEGRVPGLTPAELAGWSEADLRYYFESGFTPEFDTVGGTMVAVQENLARLPETDRAAIAAYLKALPAPAGGGN